MIQIEPFSTKFQEQVSELILAIQQNEFEIPITLEKQPDLQNIGNFYHKGHGNFWVALDGNRVVGTIALIDIGNHQTALRKMFVHKEYRGKATQTAVLLLQALFQWAQEYGVKEIYLGTTEKFLAAH